MFCDVAWRYFNKYARLTKHNSMITLPIKAAKKKVPNYYLWPNGLQTYIIIWSIYGLILTIDQTKLVGTFFFGRFYNPTIPGAISISIFFMELVFFVTKKTRVIKTGAFEESWFENDITLPERMFILLTDSSFNSLQHYLYWCFLSTLMSPLGVVQTSANNVNRFILHLQMFIRYGLIFSIPWIEMVYIKF